MQERALGNSELRVSVLTLGGNVFGHFTDQAATAEIMAAAADAGITTVDTADVYSEGLSEEIIGRCITGQRSRWVIASKAGIPSGGYPGGIATRVSLTERVDASLRRLGTDYIDVYQMHHFDPETPLEETVGALDDLRRAGKIREAGCCNYSGRRLEESWDVAARQGIRAFVAAQNTYNIYRREIEADLFPVARERGVGVLAYATLARGILAGRYLGDEQPPSDSRASGSASIRGDLTTPVLDSVAALSRLAGERGWPLSHLALAWALRRPEVSSAVIGVRSVEQLRGNLGALDVQLSPSDLSIVDEAVGPLEQYEDLSLGRFPAWY